MTGVSRIGDLLSEALARIPAAPAEEEGTPAAVMVPILDLPDPTVLFTVRSDQVRDHKGEISFPGGVSHPEDRDLLATALRETEEELGIDPGAFDVLGPLPATPTVVSGYVIQPFVGQLADRPAITPSPVEIAEVLELSVSRLAAVEREVHREIGPGVTRSWFAYSLDGYTIWGATGRILHGFLEVLRRQGWKEG
jgi:8-oxo-dGTP pyrophosphatase MutT (NUDIX family)